MRSFAGFVSPDEFRKSRSAIVAKYLYDNLRRISRFSPTGFRSGKKFEDLGEKKKRFWVEYSSGIADKLMSFDLFLRPFSDYCRTCIITDEEMEALVSNDLDKFARDSPATDNNLFFPELNHLIPASLREAGLEIIRQLELDAVEESLLVRIARVVHAGYLSETARQTPVSSLVERSLMKGFDDLSHEILQSNIDFAVHLPTRLLAIGYRIRPVRKGYKSRVLHLDEYEVETMAKVEHLRWSWEKRINGWTYGKVKDVRKKAHPDLVPYGELSENEKEKDRALVRLTPALLRDIRYEAYPVAPGKISRLSYAVKPRSSIHKLLDGINELSAGIGPLAENTPSIRAKLTSIDEKIKLSISEVQGSYNYARHIQEAFLPDALDIRECFPESFILYEPKDIISGDFYLFNRHNGKVVFALADCTGHGIPAALISTIGYGILDQTVNILRVTDPAEALNNLFMGIHRFLRKDKAGSGASDDMAIVLGSFDLNTNILSFTGVCNMVFHVTGGKISDNLSGISHENYHNNDRYDFAVKSLRLDPGDKLYISSDGFSDQFGGGNHQRYTRKKLREFLLKISNNPMPEQGDLLYEEFERWRDEKNRDEDQTDDITIIGISI